MPCSPRSTTGYAGGLTATNRQLLRISPWQRLPITGWGPTPSRAAGLSSLSSELDQGPMAVRFSARTWPSIAASGKPVLLDAYCAHMGTHLTASTSAMIVKNGLQIEGRFHPLPYHGWRYNAAGDVDDIPYFDGPAPNPRPSAPTRFWTAWAA